MHASVLRNTFHRDAVPAYLPARHAVGVWRAYLPYIVAAADVAQKHVLGHAAVVRVVAGPDVDAWVQDGHPALPICMQPCHKCLQAQESAVSLEAMQSKGGMPDSWEAHSLVSGPRQGPRPAACRNACT